MADLTAFGVGIDLPSGWDGEIHPAAASADVTGAAEAPRAILHAATFPLPPGRGDFGSGAVELMRPGDVLVILFEYGRESAGAPLFAAAGVPELAATDFSTGTMPRRVPGVVGAQRFFTAVGRAFCLHALVASNPLDSELVAIVNAVAGTIEFETG